MSKSKKVDMIGRQIGLLRVKKFITRKGGKHVYLCECNCGRTQLYYNTTLLSGGVHRCPECMDKFNKKNDPSHSNKQWWTNKHHVIVLKKEYRYLNKTIL